MKQLQIAEADAAAFFEEEPKDWVNRYRSRTYDERRTLVLDIVRAALDLSDARHRDIEVLDFGCGSGVLLRELLSLGVKVTGVDTSKAMIDAARNQFSDQAHRVCLEWLTNDSEQRRYMGRRYDIVLCVSVLEFVSDFQSTLSHLCSLLQENGVLIISVPNRKSLLRRLELEIHRHPTFFGRFSSFRHLTAPDCYLGIQNRQLTLPELRQALRGCGMREEQHRFTVAPGLLKRLESSAFIGMMLFSLSRKENSSSKPTPDFAV